MWSMIGPWLMPRPTSRRPGHRSSAWCQPAVTDSGVSIQMLTIPMPTVIRSVAASTGSIASKTPGLIPPASQTTS